MAPKKQPMSEAAIERLVAQQVANAIANYEASRNDGAETNNEGGARGAARGADNANRGCSYKEFLNCQPRSFSGTEGAVGLAQWMEKLESVFRICNCDDDRKVKYATCMLQDGALTWWNAYAQSVGIDIAYQTPWEDLKKMMTDEYCPRNELQKLEAEFWHLSVKGTDITGYTRRFQELSLLCSNMVSPEYKKIERYIWGLTPEIQGNVTSSRPATIHEAIRMAHNLMDQVVRQGTKEAKDSNNKRKWEENPEGNEGQQSNKKPETVRAYNAGSDARKVYAGTQLLRIKCNLHHTGQCFITCGKCGKRGHQTRDCRGTAPAANNCYECGDAGHIRRNCPKLKNQNEGGARGRAYVLGAGDARQNP